MKLSKFFIIVATAVIGVQSVPAQSEKLGAVSYMSPSGFTKSAQEKHVVIFSQMDQAKGSFCFITLYAAAPSSGNPQTDFASEWKTRVVEPWKGEANPKAETVPDNGWTAVAGGSKVEFQGTQAFAFLTVISGFGKTVSVLGVLNDDSCLAPLQAFVETLNIDRTPPSAPTSSAQTTALTNLQYDDYGRLLIPLPTRQLTIADIAGQWGESDSLHVRYVNRYSGTYAGADSLVYKSKMTFGSDGSFYDDFYAIQNGKMIKEKTSGSISINGRVLSIRQRNTAKYVIRGWLELPDMTILEVCGPWYDDDVIPQEIFTNPVQGANLNKRWARKK